MFILILIFIIIFTSIPIIAFSMIVAAIIKSTNKVLVINNLALFPFIFFIGMVFPMSKKK